MTENFDLNGWVLFSDRRNSQSYHSADKKWMVKFATEVSDGSIEAFEKEKEIVEKALKVGIKTPRVKDVVKLSDGRCGIIYEYIEGKNSIARAASEDLDNIDFYIEKFARATKDFHSKKCDVNDTVSWTDRILKQIELYPFLNDERKKKTRELIESTEKKNNAILGDFHTGNVIFAKDEEYIIDLGSLSYGNPIYDVSMFYWFTSMFPEFITENIFHCKREYQLKMWDSFMKYYLGYDKDKAAKFTEAVKKYALIAIFGMYDFIDATPDIPVIQKVYDEEFDKAFKNEEILNI